MSYDTLILFGSTTITAYFAYYFLWVRQKPIIHSGNPVLKSFLERHCPILQDKYSPPPLYFEGRLQTILGLALRDSKPKRYPYKRELFKLNDGGEIGLDFALVNENEKSMTVLFLPGLTSSSQSCYVRTIVQRLNKSGISVVVFNNRGIGGVPFKTARTYSASNTEDIEQVIEYLKTRFPRMIAVGTSLGGMVLCKYLLKHGKEAEQVFEAAVILSISWDANGGTANLEKDWINRVIINRQLTKSLIQLAKKFLKSIEPPEAWKDNVQAVFKAKTVRDFDTAVTAPQFGFKSVEDYYNSATTKGQVHNFPVPIFNLNSEDDPMCPVKDLPIDEALTNGSKLALITTSYGGHLGFLEGMGRKSDHFMERFVDELIVAIYKYGNELKS